MRPTGEKDYYGHRGHDQDLVSVYSDKGCKYFMTDTPGFKNVEKYAAVLLKEGRRIKKLKLLAWFLLTVIDTCCEPKDKLSMTEIKELKVDCELEISTTVPRVGPVVYDVYENGKKIQTAPPFPEGV